MSFLSTLIVIPTLNEASHIARVIAELSAELTDIERFTIVVADGGSTDGTQSIVTNLMTCHPHLRLIHNPQRLQSAAVNLAVRQFGKDKEVLVRCDAHAHYPPHFVQRLVDSMSLQSADAVVVPMDSVGDAPLCKAIAWISDTPVGSGGSAHRGGAKSGFVDHGHHAAFRMESFCRAGGYDETFSHNEDAELDCRQRAMGSLIYLDSDIRIGYLPRADLRSLWRQYANYGAGRSRTIRKHPGSMRLRQLAVPSHVALSIGAILCSPITLWPLAWPLFYLLVLALTGVLLSVRHQSAVGLLGAPAAFVMHTAWALGFFKGMLAYREVPWNTSDAKYLPIAAAQPREQT